MEEGAGRIEKSSDGKKSIDKENQGVNRFIIRLRHRRWNFLRGEGEDDIKEDRVGDEKRPAEIRMRL